MCGIYFPCFYTWRSEIVPDKGRATILNLYRIPLNLIVVVICMKVGTWSTEKTFGAAVAMLMFGCLCLIGSFHLQSKSAWTIIQTTDDIDSIPLEVLADVVPPNKT